MIACRLPSLQALVELLVDAEDRCLSGTLKEALARDSAKEEKRLGRPRALGTAREENQYQI